MTEQKTLKGLTNEEVIKLQQKYGKNQLIKEKKENFLIKILEVLKEPVFLLLIASAVIYFILGEPKDGAVMLIFVVVMIGIDVVQQWKTDKTLKALKQLSAPHIKVIRDGQRSIINSEDLVPNDLMIITEGIKIPADGRIIEYSDLCVDESSLTGEAEGVWKTCNALESKDYWRKDYVYAGTLVIQGYGVIKVDKIGAETEYGKIGKHIYEAPDRPTPLEKQTNNIIKIFSIVAGILFVLVFITTFLNLSNISIKSRIVESILSSITLAMALIPEEFPVILTVFLSMGAWRLAKKKSLVRRLTSVETLGAVSVLCVDKTGTITMNKMEVASVWSFDNNRENLYRIMGMACEINPYDPMEQAIINYCENNKIIKSDLFSGSLIKEYSFTNERKMMGHVWKNSNGIVIASKGSPEKILALCNLDSNELDEINNKLNELSSKAYRVLAVGEMRVNEEEEVPNELEDCKLTFLGLVALLDPPREDIKKDILSCKRAGVRVVMITGDNGVTASAIAKQVGISNRDIIITGNEIDNMSDDELKERVKETNIFSRVIPAHKMRIVRAFKENGEIVAMTGDGVNDAPALKYSDIGISMGKRGSEVSKEAADLILLDDNFSTIVNTIRDGRRIYDNIKKAVGYVFIIHIPIALSSLFAPLLGIDSLSLLLLPVHVVLLELIIDPTCSIVFERQPEEVDIMERSPRNPKENLLTMQVLLKSIIQGLVLFISSFGTYYFVLEILNEGVGIARSMGLSIIMISNILLVQVNSSNKEFMYKSINRLKRDKVMLISIIGTIIGLIIMLYTPLSKFLKLSPLNLKEILIVIIISVISVLWYEVIKLIKHKKDNIL